MARGWSTASTLRAHTSGGYGGAPVSVRVTGTPAASGVTCEQRLHLRGSETGKPSHTDVRDSFPCRVGDIIDIVWVGSARVITYNRTREVAEFYRFGYRDHGLLDSEDLFPWLVGLGVATGLAYITPNLFLPLLPLYVIPALLVKVVFGNLWLSHRQHKHDAQMKDFYKETVKEISELLGVPLRIQGITEVSSQNSCAILSFQR